MLDFYSSYALELHWNNCMWYFVCILECWNVGLFIFFCFRIMLEKLYVVFCSIRWKRSIIGTFQHSNSGGQLDVHAGLKSFCLMKALRENGVTWGPGSQWTLIQFHGGSRQSPQDTWSRTAPVTCVCQAKDQCEWSQVLYRNVEWWPCVLFCIRCWLQSSKFEFIALKIYF